MSGKLRPKTQKTKTQKTEYDQSLLVSVYAKDWILHLRNKLHAIPCFPAGSFAVHIRDHLWSGIICGTAHYRLSAAFEADDLRFIKALSYASQPPGRKRYFKIMLKILDDRALMGHISFLFDGILFGAQSNHVLCSRHNNPRLATSRPRKCEREWFSRTTKPRDEVASRLVPPVGAKKTECGVHFWKPVHVPPRKMTSQLL